VAAEQKPKKKPFWKEMFKADYSLNEAVSKGLIYVSVSGMGLERVEVTITSRSAKTMNITIPAGTVFAASTRGTQNMVVTEERVEGLKGKGDASTFVVDAACMNMRLDTPTTSDGFAVEASSAGGDLAKLLALRSFSAQEFRVRQFAVWTITDNPARRDYVGIGMFAIGQAPTDDEIQTIRRLFKEAGISIGKYRALRQ